jgi:hypothetical protein
MIRPLGHSQGSPSYLHVNYQKLLNYYFQYKKSAMSFAHVKNYTCQLFW